MINKMNKKYLSLFRLHAKLHLQQRNVLHLDLNNKQYVKQTNDRVHSLCHFI